MIDDDAQHSTAVAVPRLTTARLRLREFRPSDFEPFAAHHADPESTRFTGGPHERLMAWRAFTGCCGGWILHGAGWWTLEDLASRRVLGCVGAFYRATEPDLEMGWVVFREFWGQGYAVEAAGRVMQHASEVRRVARVTAIIDHANVRSQGVATKLGFQRVGDTELFGKPVERWARALSAAR